MVAKAANFDKRIQRALLVSELTLIGFYAYAANGQAKGDFRHYALRNVAYALWITPVLSMIL